MITGGTSVFVWLTFGTSPRRISRQGGRVLRFSEKSSGLGVSSPACEDGLGAR